MENYTTELFLTLDAQWIDTYIYPSTLKDHEAHPADIMKSS